MVHGGTIEDLVYSIVADLQEWRIQWLMLEMMRHSGAVFTYKQTRDALYRLRVKTGEFHHVLYGLYERF